jgi:uncharacterized protein YraI
MRVFRTPLLLGLAAVAMVLSQVPASAKEERTTSNLNFRTGPGTHYPVQAVIPAGSLVDIVSCGHEWCHLKWAGKPGYSDARWLVSHITVAVPAKSLH